MSLPQTADLAKLDTAHLGSPFCDIVANSSIDTFGLDVAHLGKPFVSAPATPTATLRTLSAMATPSAILAKLSRRKRTIAALASIGASLKRRLAKVRAAVATGIATRRRKLSAQRQATVLASAWMTTSRLTKKALSAASTIAASLMQRYGKLITADATGDASQRRGFRLQRIVMAHPSVVLGKRSRLRRAIDSLAAGSALLSILRRKGMAAAASVLADLLARRPVLPLSMTAIASATASLRRRLRRRMSRAAAAMASIASTGYRKLLAVTAHVSAQRSRSFRRSIKAMPAGIPSIARHRHLMRVVAVLASAMASLRRSVSRRLAAQATAQSAIRTGLRRHLVAGAFVVAMYRHNLRRLLTAPAAGLPRFGRTRYRTLSGVAHSLAGLIRAVTQAGWFRAAVTLRLSFVASARARAPMTTKMEVNQAVTASVSSTGSIATGDASAKPATTIQRVLIRR